MKKINILLLYAMMHGVAGVAQTNLPAKENWSQWLKAQADYTTRGTADAEYQPPKNLALAKWTDRLIPLPKEIRLKGSDRVAAGRLALVPLVSSAPAITGASNVISAFAKGTVCEAEVTIKMMLAGDINARAPSAILDRLARVPKNKDQAYAVVIRHPSWRWWRRPREILLVANQPVGLVYAARTLTQLLKPGTHVTAATVLEIPRVDIVDWPDLRQRTFPGCGGCIFSEWLAEWKLNAYQLELGSPRIDAKGELVVPVPDDAVKEPWCWVRTGAEWGVPIVPTLGHMGGILEYSFLPSCREQVAASRFKGILPVSDGEKKGRGYCPSNPATQALLAEWFSQMAKIVEGYGDDIAVWLTEGNPPDCYCSTCRRLIASGQDVYEIETTATLNAFAQVKKHYPRLRMQVTLSQGSFKVNDRVARLVLAGPPDVSLAYYDGGRTYCSNRKPMIYPVLEAFAQSGRGLGVFPQLVNSWRTTFPLTAPQFVRFRCQEFTDKQLDSIAGYLVPSQKWYFAFNIMAMAEWSWNAHGRTPAECARAYATVTGMPDPELYVRWALKAGEAGWSLAQSRLIEALIYKPDVLLNADTLLSADERRGFLYELTNIEEMKDLAAALADAREALTLAHKAADPRMVIESECTLAGLEIYAALGVVVRPMSSTNQMDAATRKTVSEQLEVIDRSAHRIRANLWRWNDIIKAERGLPPEYPPYDRLMESIAAPLAMSDTLWKKAVTLNIPDPRPESRTVPLMQWSAKDFAINNIAVMRCDLTQRVPREGGVYHACFKYVPGSEVDARIGKIALMMGKSGGAEQCVPPAGWLLNCPVNIYVLNAEQQIIIPARGVDETLALVVELHGAKGKDSHGEIGLRRCR